MQIVKARPTANQLTIGQMQLKVLRQLAKSRPGQPPPEGFFNTRGSGVRVHTLNDMLLSGLVKLKTRTTKAAIVHNFAITPLGRQALKDPKVAELPPSGWRKVIPLPTRANGHKPARRRRVA
jgi:hypothetical protein